MQYSYLLAICVSLLLLKLEWTAATTIPAEPCPELLKAAREMGLDEAAIRELWNSKKPLVIRNQNDAGSITSVSTYVLSPDGRSMSRNTVSEQTLPARLADNVPSKPQEDWEYVPSQFSTIGESNIGTDNLIGNFFGKGFRTPLLIPNWDLPAGVTPQVTTKTETNSSGQKVTTTTRTYSGVLVPGTNVFKQTFPDISREPGPINTDSNPAENPNTAAFPAARTGPTDSNSVYYSGNQGKPVFVPVIDSTTTQRTSVPLPTLAVPRVDGSDHPIEDFLAQVNLSASEIENSNGEVVKTILDKNGRILTARFVLSSVKGTEEGPQQQRPTK
ncbi:uncharacterized protein LOC6543463 [Drosophila erecta]|uniref:Uncharacterized protein n=1 Tax=Drosophila erecta TaxID=7220 RepID=B3NA85_DROER|nr:uncharacterized protein LOC6543463 [Drosophila erecta]EDV58587.1 uncharacterized protein Dere_GG10161 [Drosophila erecta]